MRLRSLASALLLAPLLAPSASAHFLNGQIYFVDDTFNQIWVTNPAVWNPVLILDGAFQPGMDSMRGVNFAHTSSILGPMLVTNASTNELQRIDEVDPFFFLTTVAGPESGIDDPTTNGLIIGPGGEVFIGNAGSSTILRLDEDYTNPVVWADAGDGIVTPEGFAFFANGDMLVANNGTNDLIRIDKDGGFAAGGSSSVWDTIPGEQPVAVLIRNNYEVFVRCLSGQIYRYLDGNPAFRTLLGDYSDVDGLGTMAFSTDFQQVYTMRSGDQDLVVVDAVSGSSSIPLSLPNWAPTSIAVVGNQHWPGAMWEWADGLAGTGGVEPTIRGIGEARLGETPIIETHDFVGGAPVQLALGGTQLTQPFFGGQIFINLSGFVANFPPVIAPGTPGAPGEGDVSTPAPIPLTPGLVHTKFIFQAGAIDPGAVQGVSLTNAMTMYIGL